MKGKGRAEEVLSVPQSEPRTSSCAELPSTLGNAVEEASSRTVQEADTSGLGGRQGAIGAAEATVRTASVLLGARASAPSAVGESEGAPAGGSEETSNPGNGSGDPGRSSGEDGQRLSPAMQDHVVWIKRKIDSNIIHRCGSVVAPDGGTGRFPFSDPLIRPPCSTMRRRPGQFFAFLEFY